MQNSRKIQEKNLQKRQISFTWIVWNGNSKFVNYFYFIAFSSQKETRTSRKQYTRFLMGDRRVKIIITILGLKCIKSEKRSNLTELACINCGRNYYHFDSFLNID